MRSLKAYIRYLRKQPIHIQHVHTLILSSAVTFLVAVAILYFDYGFWHEKYNRKDDLIVDSSLFSSTSTLKSPNEVLSNFWDEAKRRMSDIGTSSARLLEGKEEYTR
jgi:hypothetical protein